MPESKRRKPKYVRPTPPSNPTRDATKGLPPSPKWYTVLMSSLLGVGVLVVIARFTFSLDNWVTGVGLVAIAAGFFMTTNYR